MTTPPKFNLNGDKQVAEYTASDGVTYQLRTDARASEYLEVRDPDGQVEIFRLDEEPTYSTGAQCTQKWTGPDDWNVVNNALAEVWVAQRSVK